MRLNCSIKQRSVCNDADCQAQDPLPWRNRGPRPASQFDCRGPAIHGVREAEGPENRLRGFVGKYLCPWSGERGGAREGRAEGKEGKSMTSYEKDREARAHLIQALQRKA